MADSMTHRYIPRIEQTEENLFMEEYYSSTDTKIYIDDVEQTEIAYINYSLQEQLKPIYGYASRTFDDVAIGNRIVTGTIKVPIKNTEAQTQMKEILERQKEESSLSQAYNDMQQALMDVVDWITDEGGGIINNIKSNLFENDQDFEFKTKLISLGYNLDYNSDSQTFRQAIREFQKEHGLLQDGLLTTFTMHAINKAVKKSDLPTMYLVKGTKIYLKPIEGGSNTSLKEGQHIYVLNSGDGWAYIMTELGKEGYINLREVET